MKNRLLSLAERIVAFYTGFLRPLPWREDADPYRVWVSEIMLQQTRIEAVIPHYHRFLSLFPTVEALAAADDDTLMKAWEGLGYYSRVRNLRRAASEILKLGGFPEESAALEKLPGIGSYTAGAIASIAFGKPSPAVDGNVLRVLARYNADGRNILDEKLKKEYTERLAEVYPSGNAASVLTQGLMELGETICLPNARPLCGGCPLADLCLAHKNSCEESLPVREKKTARKTVLRTVFLLRTPDGKYAVRKRPDTGLLASLYEFPAVDGHASSSLALDYVRAWGLLPMGISSLGTAKHLFSHIEWQMQGYLVLCDAPSDNFLWATPEELNGRYAIASALSFYRKQAT